MIIPIDITLNDNPEYDKYSTVDYASMTDAARKDYIELQLRYRLKVPEKWLAWYESTTTKDNKPEIDYKSMSAEELRKLRQEYEKLDKPIPDKMLEAEKEWEQTWAGAADAIFQVRQILDQAKKTSKK